MTKPKVRIKPQHYLYVWSTTEYNQGGKTIYVSEGEYMRAESYIPGFSDVIWIGRGRPTVRVSLGQSPPWASTKKHFYNCRLMAARCRRRIRRLATALKCPWSNDRWSLEKVLCAIKKVVDCAWGCKTKHDNALNLPITSRGKKRNCQKTNNCNRNKGMHLFARDG